MKRGRWIGIALTVVAAFLVTLLSDWLSGALRDATEGTKYAWLLTAASIAGVGASALVSVLSLVRQSNRRTKEPPRIWGVAKRAWREALDERETLPYETKELQR
jgi:hypothetical protein